MKYTKINYQIIGRFSKYGAARRTVEGYEVEGFEGIAVRKTDKTWSTAAK